MFDNLGSATACPAGIRSAGAHLFFLPHYSIDLNPIEMLFAKLTTLFRKADQLTSATAREFAQTSCDKVQSLAKPRRSRPDTVDPAYSATPNCSNLIDQSIVGARQTASKNMAKHARYAIPTHIHIGRSLFDTRRPLIVVRHLEKITAKVNLT